MAEGTEADEELSPQSSWLKTTLGIDLASNAGAPEPAAAPGGESGAGGAPASGENGAQPAYGDGGEPGPPPETYGGESAPAYGEAGGAQPADGDDGGSGPPPATYGGEGVPAYGDAGGAQPSDGGGGGSGAYGGEGAPVPGDNGGEAGPPPETQGEEGGAPAYGDEGDGQPAYGDSGEPDENDPGEPGDDGETPDNGSDGGAEGSGTGGEPDTGDNPGLEQPPDSIPLSIDFAPPDVKGECAGGKVKYTFKGKVSVKATIGPVKQDNSFGPEIGKSVLLKVSEQVWAEKLKARVFGFDIDLTQKLKFEFSGGRKNVQAKAQYSVSSQSLGAQVAGTVFKYDFTTKELTALTLSITLNGTYEEDALEWDGHIIRDIKIEPKLGAEVEPGYLRALGESLIDRLATMFTVEAGVLAGFLMGGVLTIGAAVLTIVQSDEIVAIHGDCIKLAAEISKGFRAGAAGDAPPSGKAAMLGYDKGSENYDTALAKLKQQNPDASPADIAQAIADGAPAATANAQPQIVSAAQKAVWDDYAGRHQDTVLHSYEKERWYAWSNIYGDDPRGNPEYAKYRNEYTPGKLGM